MKSFKKFYRIFAALATVSLILVASGCDQAATNPGPDPDPNSLQLSKAAQNVTTLGWQTMSQVNTESQMSEMVSGMDGIVTEAPGMVNSMATFRREVRKTDRVYRLAQQANSLSKTTADSLIWSESWDDPISGTAGRRALFYDRDTHLGRVYEVIFRFPESVQLRYDSTEARIDFGAALEDSTDDRFLGLDKLSLFRDGFAVERVESAVEATDWDATNEVTGAIADNTVNYGNQTELQQLVQHAELEPDGHAQFAETLHYDDNSTKKSNISINPNNTGTFSEIWRDGTTASGTFDLFEDDNHGAITRTVNFANHPLLEKLEDSAEFTFNPIDSSSAGVLQETLFFLNGDIDSTRIQAEHKLVDGFWTDILAIKTANDGETNLVVTHKEGYDEIEGDHIAPDEVYYRFNGKEYEDGSGELWIDVYTNKAAYDNGEPPVLSLYIRYNPDGSGEGKITEGDKTYNVRYTANGEIEVTDDGGKAVALNGYGN